MAGASDGQGAATIAQAATGAANACGVTRMFEYLLILEHRCTLHKSSVLRALGTRTQWLSTAPRSPLSAMRSGMRIPNSRHISTRNSQTNSRRSTLARENVAIIEAGRDAVGEQRNINVATEGRHRRVAKAASGESAGIWWA